MSTIEVATERARVVVVEDHAMVRDSLVRALDAAGHDVVGHCADPDEAFTLATTSSPDVVLVDVNLGSDTDGIQLARRIRGARPDIGVAVVSMHDDERTVRRAMVAGVAGFVSKDESLDELLRAVGTVAQGGSYLSSRLAGSVMAMMGGRAADDSHLTDREAEILDHLAHGERVADIADVLFLADKTVKNHLTSIYAKLGVATAAQAVAEAYRRGLAQLD